MNARFESLSRSQIPRSNENDALEHLAAMFGRPLTCVCAFSLIGLLVSVVVLVMTAPDTLNDAFAHLQ
jgi:hypothetical protein